MARLNPKGVILSGGPASVYEPGAPLAPSWVYDSGLPVLGICYGMQAMAHQLGGKGRAHNSQGVRARSNGAQHRQRAPCSRTCPRPLPVWMSHGDQITETPTGFQSLARSENSPIVVMGNGAGMLGLQFHPEVVHTPQGKNIIENFLYEICGCDALWTPGNFVNDSIDRVREQVGGGKVICALSGGVDSAGCGSIDSARGRRPPHLHFRQQRHDAQGRAAGSKRHLQPALSG